jgi:hypothetical protein
MPTPSRKEYPQFLSANSICGFNFDFAGQWRPYCSSQDPNSLSRDFGGIGSAARSSSIAPLIPNWSLADI